MEKFINQSPLFLVIICLIIGFAFLMKGADYFVEGSSSVAKRLKVPSIIIGLTIVAMGTSLPETAVSVTASIANNNALAISNVVGSNIFNMMFVIGVCSILATIGVKRETIIRDIPLSLVCATLLLIFGYLAFGDRSHMILGRFDGIIFLIIFAVYVLMMVFQAMRARNNQEVVQLETMENEELMIMSYPKSLLCIVGGAAAIAFGGDLTVDAASRIAIDQRKQAVPFVSRLAAIMQNPLMIKVTPPNFWLFSQVISFFRLHFVRRPMIELFFRRGIRAPQRIRKIPRHRNTRLKRSTGTSDRFST